MAEQYTILGGKVHVYIVRTVTAGSAPAIFAGKNRRASTKEESLSEAKEIAED